MASNCFHHSPLCELPAYPQDPQSRITAARNTLDRIAQVMALLQVFDFQNEFDSKVANGYQWLLIAVERAAYHAESLLAGVQGGGQS